MGGLPRTTTPTIRERIARRGARLRGYDEKVDAARRLRAAAPAARHAGRSRPTTGKANFTVSPLDVLEVPEGRLLLQTLRSHDQFNTTIYGLDDRYRGIKGGRRVVFVHPDDIAAPRAGRRRPRRPGQRVAATAPSGAPPSFRIVAYDQPRGCAAAYYPETNLLVPLDSTAEGSNTPTSKSVVIRLEKPAGRRTGVIRRARAPATGPQAATDPIHQLLSRPRRRDDNLERQPRRDSVCCDSGRRSDGVEVLTPREVPLGGPRAMTVRRTLPQRQRSLIGAWCFLDHYGPDDVADTGGMSVAPHPHTGLQTVSWLFTGEIEHRDSAGHHAMVRPGELNLMTAGHGISHSEVSTPDDHGLHGAQLWVALPDVGPRRRARRSTTTRPPR